MWGEVGVYATLTQPDFADVWRIRWEHVYASPLIFHRRADFSCYKSFVFIKCEAFVVSMKI